MATPPSAAAALLSLLVLAAAAPRAALAQGEPSLLQCLQASQNLDENSLMLSLAPCAAGTSAACCDAARPILDVGGTGPVAGCVCSELGLEQTLSRVESNDLAKNFGVTRESVMTILRECKIRYAGGTGANECPSGSSKHGAGKKHDGGDWGKHGRRRAMLTLAA